MMFICRLGPEIHLFLEKLSFIFWLCPPLEDRTGQVLNLTEAPVPGVFPCALCHPFDFAAENPFAFIAGLQWWGVFWLTVKPAGSLCVLGKCPLKLCWVPAARPYREGKVWEGFWAFGGTDKIHAQALVLPQLSFGLNTPVPVLGLGGICFPDLPYDEKRPQMWRAAADP